MSTDFGDWTTPAAMAIPKEGYFTLEKGQYGPVFPRTPACYGFTIIAKLKKGREDAMRGYAETIQKTLPTESDVARAAQAPLSQVGDVPDR